MTELLLLGAGASKDAGLPDAFELTDRVLTRIAERSDKVTLDVLNFVVGGFAFPRGDHGRSPS
jgi:hypothetical protein